MLLVFCDVCFAVTNTGPGRAGAGQFIQYRFSLYESRRDSRSLRNVRIARVCVLMSTLHYLDLLDNELQNQIGVGL